MSYSRADIPGAEVVVVFFQTCYQENTGSFSNTFKVNTQHQSNISTSIQKVKERSKAIFPQLLLMELITPFLLQITGVKMIQWQGSGCLIKSQSMTGTVRLDHPSTR